METKNIIIQPSEEALILNERIRVNGQTAANALCAIGRDLRRMKIEELYLHLGYSTFEEYTEQEHNLKRRQAYQYISVYENLGEDFVRSNAQLGITKLALLTQIDMQDRAEIINENDLSEMTVNEIKELLDKVKQQGEQLSMFESQISEFEDKEKEFESADCRIKSLQARLDDTGNAMRRTAAEKQEIEKKNAELETRIKELENRPIDVAVQSDTAEIEKLNSIIKQTDLEWGKKYSELEEENIKLRQEDFQKHAAEIEQLRADYERKLSEAEKSLPAEPVPDTKEVFKAYLSNAVDAVKRLLSFVQKYPDETIFRDKIKELFDNINKTMEV